MRGKSGSVLVTLRDGRAYVNGTPLAENERDMLLAACREGKRSPPYRARYPPSTTSSVPVI